MGGKQRYKALNEFKLLFYAKIFAFAKLYF